MKNKSLKTLLLLVPMILGLQSCWLYSFSGASIPPNMKTVSVDFFDNTAPLVVPTLSQAFTEELKTRIRTQSKLNLIRDNADGHFEGRITDFAYTNVAVTAGERANLVWSIRPLARLVWRRRYRIGYKHRACSSAQSAQCHNRR